MLPRSHGLPLIHTTIIYCVLHDLLLTLANLARMSIHFDQDQFPAIFKDAIKQYEQQSKQEIRDLVAVPCDIDSLKYDIDLRQDMFLTFQKKREAIYKALTPVVELVKTICDSAGDSASLIPVRS